jgi:hypothetical protein
MAKRNCVCPVLCSGFIGAINDAQHIRAHMCENNYSERAKFFYFSINSIFYFLKHDREKCWIVHGEQMMMLTEFTDMSKLNIFGEGRECKKNKIKKCYHTAKTVEKSHKLSWQ